MMGGNPTDDLTPEEVTDAGGGVAAVRRESPSADGKADEWRATVQSRSWKRWVNWSD